MWSIGTSSKLYYAWRQVRAAEERLPRWPGRAGASTGLTEGLRFIRASTVLLSVVLVATIGNSLDKPLMYVIAPVYADEIYGSPESLGLMIGAFGGGELIGALLYGVVGKRLSRRLTFLTCFVVAPAIGFGAFAATPPLVAVLIAAAVAGVIAGPINPIFETVVQEKTPPEMLGRVVGTLTRSLSRHPDWLGVSGDLHGGLRPRAHDCGHGTDLHHGDAQHVPQPRAQADGTHVDSNVARTKSGSSAHVPSLAPPLGFARAAGRQPEPKKTRQLARQRFARS